MRADFYHETSFNLQSHILNFNKDEFFERCSCRKDSNNSRKSNRSISLALRPFGFTQTLEYSRPFYYQPRFHKTFSFSKVAVGRKQSTAVQKRQRRCSEVCKSLFFNLCIRFAWFSNYNCVELNAGKKLKTPLPYSRPIVGDKGSKGTFLDGNFC